MKGFKVFLYEMSIMDARKVMGFKSSFSAKELKAKYRRLSMKNHPDRGGDADLMKDINVAYELLKGDGNTTQGSTYSSSSNKYDQNFYDDLNKKYNDTAVIIREDLIKNLDVKEYVRYFEKIFDEPFTYRVTKIYPTNDEINRLNGGNRTSSVYNVFYEVSFSNSTKTKVFDLGLSVSLNDLMKKSTGLGASNTTYPICVHTFAYMDSRKVKITSRDYTNTTKKNVFTKPNTVFPKSKIVGKKKGKFKKSHMISALKVELQAIQKGDFYYIDTADGKFIGIYRTVMMRTPIWVVNGVYEPNERNTRMINVKDYDVKIMSFPETEEFLDTLRQVKRLSTKQAIKLLDTEYRKYIKGGK